MQTLFDIVVRILRGISAMTGLSYREINIVVYYFVIPMLFFVMIDKIIKKHVLKISLLVVWILILTVADFEEFSNWLFQLSVDFLLMFGIIGCNYTVSSVIICVFVPVAVLAVLLYYSYWPDFKKRFSAVPEEKPSEEGQERCSK